MSKLLAGMPDVDLVTHTLFLLKDYPTTHKALRAAIEEWEWRGNDRRLTAFEEFGNQREAMRRKEAGL